jgi:ribosome recycling factor
MKKLISILLIMFLVVPAWATINENLTETKAIELLRSVKGRAESVSSNLTSMRQKIEDMLANELSNLNAADQTKLNAIPTELQDIIDAADDLVTKIETHYPEVD